MELKTKERKFRAMMRKQAFGHEGIWVYSSNTENWKSKNGNYYGDIKPETITQLVRRIGDIEIYEKDILKYRDSFSDEWMMNKEKVIGMVNWNEHGCTWYPQQIKENHKGGNYISYWEHVEEIELIGNMFENPEFSK